MYTDDEIIDDEIIEDEPSDDEIVDDDESSEEDEPSEDIPSEDEPSEDDTVQEENIITPDTLTLEFVKQYLRVDHDLDDIEIAVAMKSAVVYVRKYVKQPIDEPLDYDLMIPILTLISHFYENKTPIGKANEKVDALINSILDMNRFDIL